MSLCLPCLLLVILADWRLRPEHPEGEDPIDVLIGWASFALLPVFGLLLCALNVSYRNVRYVIPFIVQLELFVSPVGFSASLVQ